MSYEKAMKHWRNHRKDRFVQQCSGYSGAGMPSGYQITPEREAEISRQSMSEILKQEHDFPIYLAQDSIGMWRVVPRNHISATRIGSVEELKQFGVDYA